MSQPKVFFSHQNNSVNVVKSLSNYFESQSIICYYAPRDIVGDYASSIVNLIEQSTYFFVLLTEEAMQSNAVISELEIAQARIPHGIKIIPVAIDEFNISELSDAVKYYIQRQNIIHLKTNSEKSIKETYEYLMRLHYSSSAENDNTNTHSKSSSTSPSKKYHSDNLEERRLEIQLDLLGKIDSRIYSELLRGKKNVSVLDLGCHDGKYFQAVLSERRKVKSMIGIDIDAKSIERANTLFARSKGFNFYVGNCESDTFIDDLRKIMADNGIASFDFVNISMVLLQIENPFRLIRLIRSVMSPKGIIFIRDIDDGINMAFPDTAGIFSELYRIASYCDITGNRASGRQMYSYLKQGGYQNIRLHLCGLNSVGMTYDEKDALYQTYYIALYDVLKRMQQLYPGNPQITKDIAWFDENKSIMEQMFFSDGFFVQLGFMIFTAENE